MAYEDEKGHYVQQQAILSILGLLGFSKPVQNMSTDTHIQWSLALARSVRLPYPLRVLRVLARAPLTSARSWYLRPLVLR